MGRIVKKNSKYPKVKPSRQDRKYLAKNDLKAVTSSFISAIGRKDDNLIIRFRNGSIYTYYNASNLYDKFLKARSKGKYFWKFIRRPELPFSRGGTLPLPSDLKVSDADLLNQVQEDMLAELFKDLVKQNVTKTITTDPATGKRVATYIVGGHVINQTLID